MSLDKLNLFQRLAAISEEAGFIPKTGHNSHHRYDYVTEPGVLAAIKPLLIKYGVFIMKDVKDTRMEKIPTEKGGFLLTSVRIAYTFVNVDRPEDRMTVEFVGQGSDNQDKGVYKAMTGCNKYAFLKTFDIATGDDPEASETKDDLKVSRLSEPPDLF